jgi:ketosteroid isomerase-like protein
MKSILKFLIVVLAFGTFVACGSSAGNKPANAPTATPNNGPPTVEALLALEKSAYEAWKNKDAKFWGTFLANNFVGFGTAGRLDKTAAIKEYGDTDCNVKSYALSDEQMKQLGDNVAFITYKTTIDATCAGKKVPANALASGIYVRSGGQWRGAFHAETPITDAKAQSAPAKSESAETKPPATDAPVDPFVALEQKAWDAWKNKDAAALDAYAGKDLVAISPDGKRSDRAAAMKSWTEDNKCEVNSVTLTNGARESLGKDLLLVTYKAAVDGTCDGQPVPTVWNATIYINDGGTWKAVLLHEVPAM